MDLELAGGIVTEPGFAPGAFTTEQAVNVVPAGQTADLTQPVNALKACVQAWDYYHSQVVQHAARSAVYLGSIANDWKGWPRVVPPPAKGISKRPA